MDASERIQLLYVTTTRARDHLVVSLHRKAGRAETNAVVLAAACAANGVENFRGEPPFVPTPVARTAIHPPPDRDASHAWLAAAQAATARRSAGPCTPSCRRRT